MTRTPNWWSLVNMAHAPWKAINRNILILIAAKAEYAKLH
jgi:hypothetical protein